MHPGCIWISVLSFLSVRLQVLCLTTPLSPHWDDMRASHAWNAVPTKWEALGHPPPDTTINLYVALKPLRENALTDALNEVSDPKHQKHALSTTLLPTNLLTYPLFCCRYGAHLSREQVAELVAPHPDTLQLINSWLEHYGVPSSSVSTSHGGGWLTLTDVPVNQANALLGASYQLYEHAETKDRILPRSVMRSPLFCTHMYKPLHRRTTSAHHASTSRDREGTPVRQHRESPWRHCRAVSAMLTPKKNWITWAKNLRHIAHSDELGSHTVNIHELYNKV
ncbi:Pro-kumamolisin, activation domain-containing protein [Lactarius quietus]|nr:Pro-kumamolisin, activation domain-containing protein [Lactarius quietus]